MEGLAGRVGRHTLVVEGHHMVQVVGLHKTADVEVVDRSLLVAEKEHTVVGGGDEGRRTAVEGDIGRIEVLRRGAVAGEDSPDEVDRGCVMVHRREVAVAEDILGVDTLVVVEGSPGGGPASDLHILAEEGNPAEEDTEDIGRVEVAGILLLHKINKPHAPLDLLDLRGGYCG